MCVAALAWHAHPRWLGVLASNRDEFTDRPTLPLHHWVTPGGLPIAAGRDARAGGTWLALASSGPAPRLALVTNVRQGERAPRADAPSRGALPLAWLDGYGDATARWATLQAAAHEPFNLLVADWQAGAAHVASNANAAALTQGPRPLPPGVHALSNGVACEPWPKTERLAAALRDALVGNPSADDLTDALFAALADTTTPPPERWPRTGVPHDVEGWLAPVCVASPDGRYATRSATVVLVERDAQGWLVHTTERQRRPGQHAMVGEQRAEWQHGHAVRTREQR